MGKSDEVFRLEAKVEDAVRGMVKVRKELRGIAGDSVRAGKEAGGMDKALGGIVSKVGGFISLGSAVGVMGKIFRDAKQEASAAADEIERTLGATKSLVQLAESVGDDARRQQRAARLSEEFGLDIGTAKRLTFAAGSKNLSDKDLATVASTKVFEDDIEGVLQAMSKVRALLPNLAASSEQIVNVLLTTSKGADATTAELGKVLLTPLKAASRLGGTAEQQFLQTAALVGAATQAAENPERTRTEVTAALSILGRSERFTKNATAVKGDLAEFLELSEREQKKFTGDNQEAIRGFATLRATAGLADQLLAESRVQISRGEGRGSLAQKIFIAENNPAIAAATAKAKADAELANVERREGEIELSRDTVRTRIKAFIKRPGSGIDPIERAFILGEQATLDFLNVSPAMMATLGAQAISGLGLKPLPSEDITALAQKLLEGLGPVIAPLVEHIQANNELLRQNNRVTADNSTAMDGRRRSGPTAPAGNSEGL